MRKRRLSNKQKKQLKELLAKASSAFALDRMDILAHLCDQIESIQKAHPDVANFRGVIAIRAGDIERAVRAFNTAVSTAPGRGEFYVNLASAYQLQGGNRKALAAYRQALECDSPAVEAYLGCAGCLMRQGELDQALQVLQQLPGKFQHNERICMLAWQICCEALRLDEAEMYLLRILECNPDHAGAHYRMALLAMYTGRFDDAKASVRHAIALDPACADAYKLLADIRKFSDLSDPELLAIQSLYEQTDVDSSDRIPLAFALGKAMHDLKQYDRAFNFFQQANSMRRQSFFYDHAGTLAGIQRIMQPDAEILASACAVPDGPAPIFIVGMPRCGSTLVEQILAAHPDVEARGECNTFQLAADSLNPDASVLHPVDIAGYSSRQWNELGAACLERWRGTDAKRVTDKTLSNIAWLGAIHAALPCARIIHVRRNPLDNCLSIYRADLQGGDFHFGFDLEELGEYYAAYLKLMQHWRHVLPAGVMYELDYEQLVADQQGETRKLLDACGLAWDEHCLQFNTVRNSVLTASAAQVRNGINSASVAAWRHYEKHLQPLIRILGEPE